MSDTFSVEIKHYRGGILQNTLVTQHDFSRPPMDVYWLAIAAGQDDNFVSIRQSDDARFDWALDWQLGNHCCYVNCKPYSISNANPDGRVPAGQVPLYKPGKDYRMIVPLWDVGLNPPHSNYWIPGIGFGWKAWRVQGLPETKEVPAFKGFLLSGTEQKKQAFSNGAIMGFDLISTTYLLQVSDEQGRWVIADIGALAKPMSPKIPL